MYGTYSIGVCNWRWNGHNWIRIWMKIKSFSKWNFLPFNIKSFQPIAKSDFHCDSYALASAKRGGETAVAHSTSRNIMLVNSIESNWFSAGLAQFAWRHFLSQYIACTFIMYIKHCRLVSPHWNNKQHHCTSNREDVRAKCEMRNVSMNKASCRKDLKRMNRRSRIFILMRSYHANFLNAAN